MHKRTPFAIIMIINLVAILALAACSNGDPTADWSPFTIEQEPAFDIQFRLPPAWLVDFAPSATAPGQWDVVLVPPRCTEDQENEYDENCVTLVAHVKDEAIFNREDFLGIVSGDIPIDPAGTQRTELLSKDTFEAGELNVQRFNHKITTPIREMGMSIFYFETEGSHYTLMLNLPLDGQAHPVEDTVDLLLGTLEVLD